MSALKLVYICNELLTVSANHVTIFRNIKHKGVCIKYKEINFNALMCICVSLFILLLLLLLLL